MRLYLRVLCVFVLDPPASASTRERVNRAVRTFFVRLAYGIICKLRPDACEEATLTCRLTRYLFHPVPWYLPLILFDEVKYER
jgi:hypothetical protein